MPTSRLYGTRRKAKEDRGTHRLHKAGNAIRLV
jgi:hypothetical protein